MGLYLALGIMMGLIAFRMFPRHVVKDFVKAPEGSRLEYVYDRIDHDSLYGEIAERELADHLRANTSEMQKIEFASIWPGAVWMAERQRASRFTTWYALAMTRGAAQTEYQHQWQAEYVNSIRQEQPQYVIIARGPRSFLLAAENEPRMMFMRLPGMTELMRERYEPDTVIRGYDVYRLREASR